MDAWQSLLEGEAEEWRLLLEEAQEEGEFEMPKKFNPYRSWANDGKALSQWKEVPLQECSACHAKVDTRMKLLRGGLCEECAIQNAADGEREQVQDLIAVECAIQRECDALQVVPSYVERFKEEVMPEQPIIIESDFMFVDHASQSCKDPVCPCRADRDVSVNLSAYTQAEFDRKGKLLTISWGAGRFIILTPEETYRLLALLHAEMPASS